MVAVHKSKIANRARRHVDALRRRRLRAQIVPPVLALMASAIWSPIALSQLACTFTQVTSSTSGINLNPSINADGTRIAFGSASNLTGGNADGNFEIFLFDSEAPAPGITQITNTPAGPLSGAFGPSINATGTRIAFSSSNNLTGGNANGGSEIFLYDANAPAPGITQITNTTGTGAVNGSPSINADGTRIAFRSNRDLTGGNADGNFEIFLYDANAPTPGFIQITNSTSGRSDHPSLNADGTRIAFTSESDLTGDNADGNGEVFIFDATAPAPGVTQITNTTGGANTLFRSRPSINANGIRTAFSSDRDLTGSNADSNFDIFLYDANAPAAGITQITNTTGGFNGLSSDRAINAAGTRIAFTSDRDLTGENPDGNFEIFLFDGNTQPPSFSQITNTAPRGGNGQPSINADGTRIAFVSNRDLTGGNADGNQEIFLANCAAKVGPAPNLTLAEKGAVSLIEQSLSLVAALIDRQGCAAATGSYTLDGEANYNGDGAATVDDTTLTVETINDNLRGTHQVTSILIPGEIGDVYFLNLLGNFWYSGEGEIMYADADFQLCFINCGDGFPGAENYDEHVIKDFFAAPAFLPDRFVLDQGLEVITKNNWPRMKFRQTSRYRPPNGGIGSISIDKVSIAPSNAPQCFIRYDAEVDDFGGGIQFSGMIGVLPL